MLLIGDDQGWREAGPIDDPPHGLLQQADLAEQRQQLLRVERARHRPEAGAGAPGQDHRVDHVLTIPPRPYSGVAHQAFPLASRHSPSFSCTTRSEKLNSTASLAAWWVCFIQLGTTKISCGSQPNLLSPIRLSPVPSTTTNTVPSVER